MATFLTFIQPHTCAVLQWPFESITHAWAHSVLLCSQRLCCSVGPQILSRSSSWHISTCSLALQMSGLFHVILPQALKTKLTRSANLCVLLLVHHILLEKLWHNEVTYCLCMRHLCNFLLQNRACSVDGSISSSKMEWDCLCIYRADYRFILLAKYQLHEASWACRSIYLSLFTPISS